MNKIILLVAALLCAFATFAQTGQLKGKVLDAANNTPLVGANVEVVGSNTGVVTNENGEFVLDCTTFLDIKVSYIGYETYQQKATCETTITIALVLSPNNLNTVEITETSNPHKELLYQPVSIAKLGQLEITRSTGILLEDAVNINIPGVFMERRTFAAGQQFNIRGYGNGARGTNGISSNFDGQGYKVYLNGIPITDAEGITLMDDIDFGSIGNVEVVKGPAGTLYGQAIAGVVNLKTVQPTPGKVSIGQNLMFGSYGLRRYTTQLQIGGEKASLLANYGRQSYDGFMPHTASKKDFVNLYGNFTPNKKQIIGAYFGYSNSYDERNGELTIGQYDTLDYSGNSRYIKNDAHSNVMTFRTGVSHTYKFHETVSNTTTLFGTGLVSNVSSAGGWTDKSSINYGVRSTFDTRFKLSDKIVLSGITGVEAQMQNAQTLGYPMVVDSFDPSGYNIIGALRSNQYTISKTLSAFTEWTLALPYDFSLTAGIGYSVLDIQLNDRFYAGSNNNPSNPNAVRKPTQFNATYGSMFSPHVAINKVISKQASVYASFSTGYKAPVSSYFFIPLTGQVLTNLKPEHGTQYEVGTKGLLWKERINYQVALFYAKFTDKFTTVAVPDSTNTATSYVYMANGGTQNHMGVEVSIRAVAFESKGFLASINPFVNLAYSHFRYGDFRFQQLNGPKTGIAETDFTDNVVAGVAPITFNAGVDLMTKPGLYANVTYSFRDKMYYTSDNLNQTKAYSLLNAKIGYRKVFAEHYGVEAYVGAINLTGTQYYNMVFVNQLPDAYLPAPNKVNFFGGVNLKYIF
ncbi:TonB-dependent receptor [soil metagenome]